MKITSITICNFLPPPVDIDRKSVKPIIGLNRKFVNKLLIGANAGIVDAYAMIELKNMLITVAVKQIFRVAKICVNNPSFHMLTQAVSTSPKFGKNDFSGTKYIHAKHNNARCVKTIVLLTLSCTVVSGVKTF